MKNKVFYIFTFTLLSLTTMIAFQNCGGSSGSAETASASGQPTSCPQTSNPSPVVNSITPTNINFNIGMGRLSGTDAPKNVSVNFSSGDSFSRVIDVDCRAANNNSGLDINCDPPANASANGSFNVSIDAADDAECLSGAVTIEVTVSDAIVNAQNAPINACNALERTSAVRTFTVTRANTCPATQRVNPTAPYYNAGQMGRTVAIDNDWAVATAPGDEFAAVDAGAAYVLRRTGTTWAVFQKLVPSNISTSDSLSSAAISGTTLVLGAPLFNTPAGVAGPDGDIPDTGAAWVYQFNGTQWVQVKTFTSPSGASSNFGSAVAVSGSNIAISAPKANLGGGTRSGAVYLYSGANWDTVISFAPAGGATAQGEFGTSVALSGNNLVVGAPFPNAATTRDEAVYIYNISNSTSQKILNPGNIANARNRFGYSLSIDGTNLLVGAPYHTNERGIAYLYRSTNGTFASAPALQYVLSDPNNDDVDRFGTTVAIKGTRVVVGAPDKDVKVGAAYLYNTTANTQLFKLQAPLADRSASSFSSSIGISADGWLVSGAMNDEHDANIDNSGSVYFVRLP
jgi:FG-GAP repeat